MLASQPLHGHDAMPSPRFAAPRFTPPGFAAPRRAVPGLSTRPLAALSLPRLAARLHAFLRADRDRWVLVVCALGFSLLTGMDWLAA